MLNYIDEATTSLGELMTLRGMRAKEGCLIAIQEIIHLLKAAVVYTLPENGIVGDLSAALDNLQPSMVGLPSPVVALQYHVSDFSAIKPGEYPVPKRIALCVDCTKGTPSASPFLTYLVSKCEPAFQRHGGIIVVPIYFIEGIWMPNAFGSVLISTTTHAAGDNVYLISGQKLKTASVPVSPFPLMPEMAHLIIDQFGIDQALRDAAKDVNDEMLVLAGMLAARTWTDHL
jgi:hypothetical protein